MPRRNAAEALPAVPESKDPKPAKKKKHLKLVEEPAEEVVALKDGDLEEVEDATDEAELELEDGDLEEVEDLTREARRIKDEEAMKEARKNLESIPDLSADARLMDEGDRVVEITEAASRAQRTRSADEVYPMDNMYVAPKPKPSLLNRIKGWFSKK